MPEPFNLEVFRQLRPQNSLSYFESIPSTMVEATRLAKADAPDGTIVLAEEQTMGQGRLGRSWTSSSMLGLYVSVLMRWQIPVERLPLVSLVLALCTAEAIEIEAKIACDLRWPNDVLVGGRKIAGILPYAFDSWVIAGIGINVFQTDFPPGLRTPATSLLLASGREGSRERLLAVLLGALDDWHGRLLSGDKHLILDSFTRRSKMVAGCPVVLEESGRCGITAGLDEDGFLLVQMQGGKLERVTAGGVRPEAA